MSTSCGPGERLKKRVVVDRDVLALHCRRDWWERGGHPRKWWTSLGVSVLLNGMLVAAGLAFVTEAQRLNREVDVVLTLLPEPGVSDSGVKEEADETPAEAATPAAVEAPPAAREETQVVEVREPLPVETVSVVDEVPTSPESPAVPQVALPGPVASADAQAVQAAADGAAAAVEACKAGDGDGEAGADAGYWLAVRSAVASKLRYPAMARRRGEEGRVVLKLTLDGRGELVNAESLESTAACFSESALDAVRKAAPFSVPTNCLATALLTGVLPVRFQLTAAIP